MNSTPSVLHIIRPQPVGSVGGADLHLLDLVEHQVRNGQRVAVLPFANQVFGQRAVERGAQVADVGAGWRPYFLARLRRFIRQQAIAIVHGHGYLADLVAIAARQTRGRSSDRTVHQPLVVLTAHGFIRATPLLRLQTAIDERCLHLAHAVITTSRIEAARLQAMLPDTPVQAIPNGIHMPSGAAPAPHSHPPTRLAFLGRLAPEKRPDIFLRVAAELAADHPALRFLIVGSGPLEAELRSMARRLGIAGRCDFTGLVTDVHRMLRDEIDILVSLSDSEGTPRAVLEAMANGVAVVATDVGGVPELITPGTSGLLVPTGSATAAAAVSALRGLLADDARRQALCETASRTVRARFSLDVMAERVTVVYQKVLNARDQQEKLQGA